MFGCLEIICKRKNLVFEFEQHIDITSTKNRKSLTSTFQTSSDPLSDASVMEQVARSKFEGKWSPRLLEMVLVYTSKK